MFEMPTVKIVRLDVEDVITTSGVTGDSNFGGGDEE